MYENHFGLRQRPFRCTPDSTCYYPSTCHEQALEWLLQGIHDHEGLCLLTGEPGLGKTLLCHGLLHRVEESSRSAFLTNSHIPDRVGLLQALAYELGVGHEGLAEQPLRLAITDYLLHGQTEGRPTLLFVDEAHHLGVDVLEELRLLSNLESGEDRAIQIILVGQPTICQTLAHQKLASLRQRLAVRPCLEPLTESESADYLLHHFRLVTDRADLIMTAEALELIARGTGGVPRLLNQVAHRSLILACAGGSSCVDAEAAIEAMLALGLEVEEPTSQDETTERGLAA